MSAAWEVIPSPTDAEMSAVHGVYLVADNLPIEDARLIAAAPVLLAELIAAVEIMDDQLCGDFPESLAAMRAAIAKATRP